MKRQDILTLIMVGVVAAIFSLITSTLFFSGSAKRQEKVEIVEAITPSFTAPADDPVLKDVFNASAVDPTQLIRIGDGSNENPFTNATQ